MTAGASEVLTPTLRQTARRWAFWVVVGLAVILFAIGSIVTSAPSGEEARLSPTSAAPDGARAVVEVLRDRGVNVTATSTLDETEAAVADPASTTLLVLDSGAYLDDAALSRLLGLSSRLVLLEPDTRALARLAPEVRPAGTPDDDPLAAGCALPAAVNAGEVSPGGTSYRADPGADAELCLVSDSSGADDAYSLVRVETEGTAVSVVGSTDAITNTLVLDRGNAAFALTLLGETDDLVWYLPTIGDSAEANAVPPTPGWVTPTLVLLALVTVAAAVWRGRRFGPLIVENLPVHVASAETMQGRARLYQASSARLRALDALRLGAIGRLARMCGLSSSASVEEVVHAVAAAVGADAGGIRTTLLDAVPATDAELVDLSDRLLELESATAKATRP